jgi:acetyltransferase-like isoleucine patch superfamily enzyme
VPSEIDFVINVALKILDPSRLLAIHRTLQFRCAASCSRGFKASSRSNIFAHRAERQSIRFGAYARVDGTVEVYERGRLTVGSHFFLGRSRIYCAHEMNIGNYVLISDNVSIMDSDLHPIQARHRRGIAEAWSAGAFPDVYVGIPGAAVSIADDVWIGFGASVLKGVTIGQGAIVGAGSLVNADVPPWTMVAGTPARVIRELAPHER